MYSASLRTVFLSYYLEILVRYFSVRDYLVALRSLVSSPVFDCAKYIFIGEFALRFSKRCSEVVRIPHKPVIWCAYRISNQMAD